MNSYFIFGVDAGIIQLLRNCGNIPGETRAYTSASVHHRKRGALDGTFGTFYLDHPCRAAEVLPMGGATSGRCWFEQTTIAITPFPNN